MPQSLGSLRERDIRRLDQSRALAERNGTRRPLQRDVQPFLPDGEQWKSTESFSRGDLLVPAKVADLSHSWIVGRDHGDLIVVPGRIHPGA